MAGQTRGTLLAALLISDQAADLSRMWTNLGASVAGTAQTNTMSNATAAGVGNIRTTAILAKSGLMALWKGANAEGIRETNLTQLLNFLGLGIFDDVL